MIKILITGKNSYVGTSLERWLENFGDCYLTESISLKDDSWRNKDFSYYDVVIHVAGIAHIKETKENADVYFKVNRDLAFDVAQKAKRENVKQFIFFSSMSVYGIEEGVIDRDTLPEPKSNYGKSKLAAEELIVKLEDVNFKVSTLRPPMIYGKECKGNYNRLASIARKLPIFPDIDNKRSMIYIDNLSEFVRVIIEKRQTGIFFPQNNKYVNTTDLVKHIARTQGKEIKTTKIFNWAIAIGLNYSGVFRKVFGTFVYDEKNAYEQIDCETVSFEKSIIITEKKTGD